MNIGILGTGTVRQTNGWKFKVDELTAYHELQAYTDIHGDSAFNSTLWMSEAPTYQRVCRVDCYRFCARWSVSALRERVTGKQVQHVHMVKDMSQAAVADHCFT